MLCRADLERLRTTVATRAADLDARRSRASALSGSAPRASRRGTRVHRPAAWPSPRASVASSPRRIAPRQYRERALPRTSGSTCGGAPRRWMRPRIVVVRSLGPDRLRNDVAGDACVHGLRAMPARPDEIWLTEHPPVYTLGLAGRREHLLRDNGIPMLKVDRGGQITYHGPGQLVAYTLFDLRRRAARHPRRWSGASRQRW